jgi:hypothetical protein
MVKKAKTPRTKKPLPSLERGARSKAVRDYLAANPKDSPQKVVAALKEQGVEVSLGLVSVIKYSKPKSNRGGLGTTADALLQTKKLVDAIGFDNARLALDVLEKLR